MNLAFFRGLTNAPAIRTDKVRLKIFISVISIIISSILLCLSFKFQWLDGKVIAIVMIGAAVFWIILLIWAERKIKYVFIIPTTVILIIITIIPFIYLLNLSVHNVKAVTFNKEWVSKTEIKKKLNNLLEFEYPDIITEIKDFIEVLE